jgi:NAD(P)-dependent dehydrogenase (short-subunit alcohol dehydrogenase family)
MIGNMTSGVAEMADAREAGALNAMDRQIRYGTISYATTKAALNRLTNATAAELTADNIAVVAVDPGLVDPDRWTPASVAVRAVIGVLTHEDQSVCVDRSCGPRDDRARTTHERSG